MENNLNKNKEFVMPTVEVVVFSTADVVAVSGGGFDGEWDPFGFDR